jgi:phosphoglycolate phosphatase
MEILFDLDGTLTDPKVGILTSVQHALRQLGEPVPPMEELHWCIGPPLKNAFLTMFGPDQPERVAEAVGHFRERFGEVGLFENEVYPGIPGLLAALRQDGHRLHVATSKPRVFAVRILDHFGLAEFFASVNGSELDGALSDKAELIAHIIADRDLDPADTVMIGDREHDMIGAVANGVSGLGVLWGYGTRHELETAGARACVAEVAAVPAAVRGLA